MILSESPKIELIHGDCMDYMNGIDAKTFDLAIVDPEYGIGASEMTMGKGKQKKWIKGKKWDTKPPDSVYFTELFRVSANQIIWGGNYFNLEPRGGWLIWDKVRNKNVSFGDGEMAWTNFLNVVKLARIPYDGFIGADIGNRIHPTQKPVKLYRWLLQNYAKPGDRILDTHLGSGSSAIAAFEEGFDFVGIELDREYYDGAVRRFRQHIAQTSLF